MNVLGVHIGHDSSAALVCNGKIVADVAEERFVRIKHYSGLPINAIAYCLRINNITIDDIDIIAVPSNGSVPYLNFLFDLQGRRQERKSKKGWFLEVTKRIWRAPSMKPPIYINNFPLNKSTDIFHVEHHLAHAASAYFTSGLREKQLIITSDGAGDGYSICVWHGDNGEINPLKKFDTSGSLGWFYSNVTEALGWWHGDGEGKTMGLAPYGDLNKVKGALNGFYPKYSSGDLIEPYDYKQPFFWNENGGIQWHFDDAYRIREIINRYNPESIAAEAQRVLEEQTAEIIYPWMAKEGTQNLSCAGGVFLNVKLNQRIWESRRVRHHHVYPNAGDSGLAVGAALYVYYKHNRNETIYSLDNLYLGPEYSDHEIKTTLDLRNIKYEKKDNIEEFAAQQLAQGKILAWYQGRMESGPRALGNRSILMSANRAENKDIINARVKFREAFRPFCPSILWEKKHDYLINARDEFFMITSFTCMEAKRGKVPAVVHADNTLRPQMVKKEFNKPFWNLINEFGKITGEYLLLNTSFNVMGEPIVNMPRDAIRCFYDNGLDFLIIGNFVISK